MTATKKDAIEISSHFGECQIQLYFGSVTKLKPEDAVDVLVVSAYPGSYTPTPMSVIGALFRDLKINVMKLAKDKEEDLREVFSCWWSKPLPAKLKTNFKRLLCFEGGYKKGSIPSSVVGEVFRCLVSLCKNKDIKVAMPLLATGDQGYSRKFMLRLIVDAAVHWMQVGLPLRELKIVIYSSGKEARVPGAHMLWDYFKELKKNWLERIESEKGEEAPEIRYDVYLSYAPSDEKLAERIKVQLQTLKEDVRIFQGRQNINEEESWQEDIYQVMSSCARVVTILTPAFLKERSCLEQYNIALCCSRSMKRDFLAPLYIKDVGFFPTYMGLVQYIDCRPLADDKVYEACREVSRRITADAEERGAKSRELLRKSHAVSGRKATYELFISYSRVNAAVAQRIKAFIGNIFPDWRIFIDTSVLQAGNIWQSTLYKSIESSKIVLALLSPTFIASKVCREEFNLSVLLHLDSAYFTHLIPVLAEPVDVLPVWCRAVKVAMDVDPSDEKGMAPLVPLLKSYLEAYDSGVVQGATDILGLLASWRNLLLRKGIPYFPELKLDNSMQSDEPCHEAAASGNTSDEMTVFVSYHEKDAKYALLLMTMLRRCSSTIIFTNENQSVPRHDLMDSARMIVPLLSVNYLASPDLFSELNIGMCRLRYSTYPVLVPILLEPLQPCPAFARLLPVLFAIDDVYWLGRSKVQAPENVFWFAAACLKTAASFIGQILSNPSKYEGEYKLLINIEEIDRSIECLLTSKFTRKRFHPLKALNQINR